MKKAIAVISITLCISFVLPLFAYADVTPTSEEFSQKSISKLNSSNIEPYIYESLGLDTSSKIIKIYNTNFVAGLSQICTIEEFLNSNWVWGALYITLSDSNKAQEIYECKKGGSPVNRTSIFRDSVDVAPYFDESIIKNISPDISVYNTYYLRGDARAGIVLYYETDMGDYVYHQNTKGKHLMPCSVFYDCIRVYLLQCSLSPVAVDGTFFPGTYDLSKYDINSDNFNPHYLPAHLDPNVEPKKADIHWPSVAKNAAGVAIAIAIGSLIWWKRKRDENYDFW